MARPRLRRRCSASTSGSRAESADLYFDRINAALATPEFRPRALFERFNIEVIATTECAARPLAHHAAIRASGWRAASSPPIAPTPVVDPEFEGFRDNVERLGAHRRREHADLEGLPRRAPQPPRVLQRRWAPPRPTTAIPTALTATSREAKRPLFQRALTGTLSPAEAELFRGQMLTEMARMSIDDGLVMQIHPASSRNHNPRCSATSAATRAPTSRRATEYVGR